jgi:hypothetical protein
MISNRDFFSEIEWLDKTCEDCKDLNIKALLKANILTAKLVHNMRTNQVLALRAGEVALVPSKRGQDDSQA